MLLFKRFIGGLLDIIASVGIFSALSYLYGDKAFISIFFTANNYNPVIFFILFNTIFFTVSDTFWMNEWGYTSLLGVKIGTVKEKSFVFLQLFWRNLVKMLSLLFLGIPFIFVFFNKEHKALHDVLSGTYVYEDVK